MRPNVDIPWSIHGQIKQYAQANEITIEEGYIEALKTGTDQLAIPDESARTTLSREDDWLPFGPWKITSQGDESPDINDVTTCLSHFYTPEQPVKISTRRRDISVGELESMLATLQARTRISDDWFTIHQLGGAWVGRGLTNFAHGISTVEDLFAQADFPLYKQGSAVYIANLPRESEYLFLRMNLSRRGGRISNFQLTFLLDGYPVGGREYYKIAQRLGFSELFNAKEHHLPTLRAGLEGPLEVEVVERITKGSDTQDDPSVSGLIIENPFQNGTNWATELSWDDIPDGFYQNEAEAHTDVLSNYDHLYCELNTHHRLNDDANYRMRALSATYLSGLLERNHIWNISASVDW